MDPALSTLLCLALALWSDGGSYVEGLALRFHALTSAATFFKHTLSTRPFALSVAEGLVPRPVFFFSGLLCQVRFRFPHCEPSCSNLSAACDL